MTALSSMTGYGHATLRRGSWQIEVSLRALNSKYFDCSLRLPHFLEAQELSLRKMLSTVLIRGKVALSVQCTPIFSSRDSADPLDVKVFKRYWASFKHAASTVRAKVSDDALFSAIVRIPTVLRNEELSKDEQAALWQAVQKAIQKAMTACQDMQRKEGKKTAALLLKDIKEIKAHLQHILRIEPTRSETLSQKLRTRVQEALSGSCSEEKLAQEIFFYVERMDFGEEKERLLQHLDFFKRTVSTPAHSEAKRLLFIAQEIGREINTLGSKSQDATIQEQVVHMKSALERIKEQLQNLK